MAIDQQGYERAQSVMTRLSALDSYDEEAVLDIIQGIGTTLFMEMDERPGAFDHKYNETDWHWKLRRARNRAPGFFKAINEEAL